MYSYQEVYESTLKYFRRDKLATDVWINKYVLKDQEGNIHEKNPDDMHRRLSKELARIESNYPNPMLEQEIYELLKDFKYVVPGGSPMEGIGNSFKIQSVSNCYVIGNKEDSYGSILKIDEEQAHIMRRRGGVGSDLSYLRPNGAKTTCAANSSTGVVPFAERYSNSTRETAQEGRRGARMISLDITHPDAEEFIDAKLEKGKITGANISVRITDEFMNCVKNDKNFYQTFPIDKSIHEVYGKELTEEDDNHLYYNVLYKSTNGYYKKINAKKLWNKIILNAWKSAEPGILFIDHIRRESPSDCYGSNWFTESSNPCGEIPMNPYSSCILTAINLYNHVENPFTVNSKFNFDLFRINVIKGQRIIDDIVDIEIEKIDQILDKVKKDPESEDTKLREINLWTKIKQRIVEGRRTGLGITAEGDMLAALGLTYGTKDAIEFSEKVHKLMAIESYKSSIIMAKERGCFPIWDLEKEEVNPFILRVYDELEEYDKVDYCFTGRRNIANLTIAPTGSVSIMTQTTSGIEPVYKVYYTRRKKTNDKSKANFTDEQGDMWEEFKVFHHKFVEWFIVWNELGLTYEEGIKTLISKSEANLQLIIENSPYYKATSDDVDYLGKIELQGRVQKWVDHSISVTVNMPENVSKDMVSDVYMKAFDVGCKGVTIYREGSRTGVLIANNYSERPKEVSCDINHLTIKGIKWVVIVGLLKDKPYEVFCLKDIDISAKYKTGKLIKIKSKIYDLKVDDDGTIHNITNEFDNPLEGALTRQISLNLKHSPIEDVYIQLQKEGNVTDFNKAVARTLKKYLIDKDLDIKCPECNSKLVMESGCIVCKNCGHSKC